MIKSINNIMSLDRKQFLLNSKINRFKTETFSFSNLGFPDKKVFFVVVSNTVLNVEVEQGDTTRTLNKLFKGSLLKEAVKND